MPKLRLPGGQVEVSKGSRATKLHLPTPGERFSLGQNPANSTGISSGRWGHFRTSQENRNALHTGAKVLQGHPGLGTVWKSWILWLKTHLRQGSSSRSQTPKLWCFISKHTSLTDRDAFGSAPPCPQNPEYPPRAGNFLFGNVPSPLSLLPSPSDAHPTFLVL